MRRTKRSKSKFIVGILSIIILVLTIGYSFLSLNLRVLGLAHIGAVWNIHFDNITINPDSVSLSQGDIEPEIDEDNDWKVNYKVTLTPGDFYEFTFDIVNEGTIDGMIQNIITRVEEDATASLPSYINYSVSYEDDVVLETNQQLLAGTTETLKVRVEFKDEENVPGSETLDLSYESNYVKKTSSATRVKHPQPLYNVLQDAVQSGLAIQYTGEHHDSFTEEPSKNIYHWYGSNDTNGTAILDKNNVIFANHCWQMIRTTDTGGVKLLYNGEPENSQCLDSRGNHVGYSTRTYTSLNSNYWYGTDYTYDSTNHLFSIAGTTEQTIWSDSTYAGLIGKYTCKSLSASGTCSTLYYVESYKSETVAYLIQLKSDSLYSQFGRLEFNANSNSPAYVGYMYGGSYEYNSIAATGMERFETITYYSYAKNTFLDTYLYSKTYIDTGSEYELVNPVLGSDIPEDDYVGYFTFRSETESSGRHLYFILDKYSGNSYYSIYAPPQSPLSSYDILLADSITDNLDGTYSLNNAQLVTAVDWVNNYESYLHKYTCNDSTTTTCSKVYYLIENNRISHIQISLENKIMIGKGKNNLTLTDTLLLRKDELVTNRSNYSDYIYTCNTDSATCTNAVRRITSFNDRGYSYYPYLKYGSSVTWDGTDYSLVDPVENENNSSTNIIKTHHYICLTGLTTCQKVAYITYYQGSGSMYYFIFQNGVLTPTQALGEMFVNTKNSTIKKGVEEWYKKYLYDNYDQYIEDTIFCNDRTITSLGAWDANGGGTTARLDFKEKTISNDLSCTNVSDKFSTLNSSARTTYKVGLLSVPEVKVLNNNILRKHYYYFWLMSPYDYPSTIAEGNIVNGSIIYANVSDGWGVVPSISLIPGIKYTDGDGSKANPYIIKTN